MDNTVLKKKLSTFKSAKGSLTGVSNEVLWELLHAWENWPSTTKEFYQSIGMTKQQAARILGKAKKLSREDGKSIRSKKSSIQEAAAYFPRRENSYWGWTLACFIWRGCQAPLRWRFRLSLLGFVS